MKFFKFFFAVLLFIAFSFQNANAEKFKRFVFLPVLSYSEETSLEYGAMGLFFFKPRMGGKKVSTIDVVALGTLNNQYELRSKPDFFWFEDRLHTPTFISISNWESAVFEHGTTGNFDPIENYERTAFCAKIPFEMNFGFSKDSPFRYGIIISTEFRKNNFEKHSAFTSDSWENFYGGGYLFSLDTRDNRNFPTHGFYLSFEEMFYIGDYDYHTETLDGRFYAPLFWTTSVALGAEFQQSAGNHIPLGNLAGPDGINRFRGVDPGVWNDTQALILQIEFRKKLSRLFVGTIFSDFLQTAPYFSDMFRNKWHYGIGAGLQLALNTSEHLYARGDISLIDGKHIGLTVNLREAF